VESVAVVAEEVDSDAECERRGGQGGAL